jgi:Amt family ammonium transporter
MVRQEFFQEEIKLFYRPIIGFLKRSLQMNSGDTAFMLVATAMVMLMTPGLALFYGGMVRSKNVLSTLLQSFICLGVVTIIWVLYGYSMAFGPDVGGFVGNLDFAGLAGVGLEPGPYSDTIPHLLF